MPSPKRTDLNRARQGACGGQRGRRPLLSEERSDERISTSASHQPPPFTPHEERHSWLGI